MPEPVQLRRTKGWRMPPGTLSVARPHRWGNPFPVSVWGLDLSLALFSNTAHGIWDSSALGQDKTDEQFALAYQQHHDWLRRLGGHPVELARTELRGFNLACFCPLDQRCHRLELLELANPKETP